MAFADAIYEKLTNEEDARLCSDISQDACRETPRSFVLLLSSYFFTKLGDALASPKTTLAWLTTVVGAPAWVLGFLVPIRESGSLIPQLFIGGFIRTLGYRKWVWVAGSIAQCLCIAGIGLVAFTLSGAAAGWAILGLITAFSLARGFCSVASKDVLGKTIPKARRGQLTGWSASAAGLVAVGLGAWLVFGAASDFDHVSLGVLLVAAGSLWLAAAFVYATVPEHRGATDGGRNLTEALGSLRLLVTDAPFRRFVTTRALLMCSALSAPFYVALAQQHLGSPPFLLGAFVAAAGIASLVSAPFWGRFADASSRTVMIAAAVVTASVGLVTFAADRFVPAVAEAAWFLPLAYFT
ncbi:MAG: MFS transporter, partial [Woeseiaceae bacterium]|nr:MFS transporter [Woeseiaceae bacterium]